MVRQWSVRDFSTQRDVSGVVKLLSSVSHFDGGVVARSKDWVDAALASSTYPPENWRVAVAANNAIVGAMLIGLIGTLRTDVVIGVNPAWRKQGVGRALLDSAPKSRRLLVETRASIGGATGLLLAAGFKERHRLARMRRKIGPIVPPEFPSWASIEEDLNLDPERFRRASLEAFGDDVPNLDLIRAELARPGTRLFYLVTPQGDQGLAQVCASDRSKKGEVDDNGASKIGVLQRVGLARPCRGKGISRHFIRKGLMALAEDGYSEFEVIADKRRSQVVELYAQDGFEEVDEDVLWIRRDDA